MAKQAQSPRRVNRVIGVAEALGDTLGPVLKKRGFASRDILIHWRAIAPAPYDVLASPDRLAWPRGEKRAEGGVLHLRCAPGHGLALTHDAPAIAAAVNRYFGYLLVGRIKLSPEPFTPHSAGPRDKRGKPGDRTAKAALEAVAHIEDAELREALHRLGLSVLSRSDANGG